MIIDIKIKKIISLKFETIQIQKIIPESNSIKTTLIKTLLLLKQNHWCKIILNILSELEVIKSNELLN